MKWTFHFETREHFDLRIIIAAKNAYVGFGYEIGLKNINKTEDDISLKNSNFFVNLGYVF